MANRRVFDPVLWIAQEFGKVTADTAVGRYIEYRQDYNDIGGAHRLSLLIRIYDAFAEVRNYLLTEVTF